MDVKEEGRDKREDKTAVMGSNYLVVETVVLCSLVCTGEQYIFLVFVQFEAITSSNSMVTLDFK